MLYTATNSSSDSLKRKREESSAVADHKPFKRSKTTAGCGISSKLERDEDRTIEIMMRRKTAKSKTFAGLAASSKNIPTLVDLCSDVLRRNISSLLIGIDLEKRGFSFGTLNCILSHATPDQLSALELSNPRLLGNGATEELWKLQCRIRFPNKVRRKLDTWRDTYFRPCDDSLVLKALISSIKGNQIDDRRRVVVLKKPPAEVKSGKIKLPSSAPKMRHSAKSESNASSADDRVNRLQANSKKTPPLATACPSNIGQRAIANVGNRKASSARKSSMAPLMRKAMASMKNYPYQARRRG